MTSSVVEKGKRYEKKIAQMIVETGLDSRASRESGSGNGLKKGDIRSNIPFLIEAKNEKGVPKWLLKRIDQAKKQADIGWAWKEKWALVFRDPRTPENNSADYVVVDLQEFLNLLKRNQEPKIKEPDKSLNWKLQNLKNSISAVMKELE